VKIIVVLFLASILISCSPLIETQFVEVKNPSSEGKSTTILEEENLVNPTSNISSTHSFEPTIQSTKKPTEKALIVEVCIDVHSLNIRSGPGTNFDSSGYLLNGDCVYLRDRTSDSRWARFDRGWIGTYFLASEDIIESLPIHDNITPDEIIISTSSAFTPTDTAPNPTLTPKPTSTSIPTIRPTNTPYTKPPTATQIFNDITISWDEAKFYIGEYKIVCGKVIDTYYASSTSGQPTFINIGQPYPDVNRFTVIIWGENRYNFPSNLESYYYAETICVSGSIENYQGSAQIEATSSSQIKIQ